MNIPEKISISKQKKYINDILGSKDNTICGLFINNKLVGTVGVQSSTSFIKYIKYPVEYVAVMGIFVLNKSYRGRGLGKTLVWASTYLFHDSTQTEWFGAGMKKQNIPSLKSFLSCGFKCVYEDAQRCHVLLKYSGMIRPHFIYNFRLI